MYNTYYQAIEAAIAALAPFAAKVHTDGVEAPYPEDEWIPLLEAAKKVHDRLVNTL